MKTQYKPTKTVDQIRNELLENIDNLILVIDLYIVQKNKTDLMNYSMNRNHKALTSLIEFGKESSLLSSNEYESFSDTASNLNVKLNMRG